MLETTLSATFSPSANLKGQAAGANWLFLLPSLPLERAICLGMPARTTLTTLAALCQEVVVLDNSPQQMLADPWQAELENVDWGALNRQTLLQWPDDAVDLVLVDRQHTEQYRRQAWLQGQVRRLLKAGGWIHYEYRGLLDPLRGMHSAGQAHFWLTPLSGEAATVAPREDRATMAYFTAHTLYSPSFKLLPSLKQWARTLRGKKTAQPPQHSGANGSPPRAADRVDEPDGVLAPATPPYSQAAPLAPAQAALRAGGAQVLKTLDRAVGAVERHGLHSPLLRRTAVLSGPSTRALVEHPPAYLRRAAAAAGINLDHYGWGLVAPADYSSRKLLFFLFERSQPGQTQTLRYIVKMVRNPSFNARLENEQRALTLLHTARLADHDAIPRVVFSGYHAGRVLVGESAIEGVPFRSRSQGRADCPYLQRAVGWLTDLADATATWQTSNRQAAAVLHGLLDQFSQLYRLAPEHRAFLAEQIEQIAASAGPLPAVFQHGDPGLWNLLITPTGRVAFLDWEAAETAGMPLWDFFHLIRSYSVHAARMQGVQDSLQAVQQQLLADTPLRQFAVDAIRRYGERIQLPAQLVSPLFYTCWMHRAIKEASRLPAAQIEQGHYVSLLRLCIDQRHVVAPALQLAR